MLRVSSCCCGCTLKTGTILIGVFHLIVHIVILISVPVIEADPPETVRANVTVITSTDNSTFVVHTGNETINDETGYAAVYMWCTLSLLVLGILVNGMLIYAAVKEKPKPLYIWVIVHAILLVLGTISQVKMAIYDEWGYFLAAALINILLTTYFLIVVYSYYKELKEKLQPPPVSKPGQGVFVTHEYPPPPPPYSPTA